MASLWQRHRPIATDWAQAQAWATSPALLGRARQRRHPWQRFEASMWTPAAAKKDPPRTKTTDPNTPPTPDASKPTSKNAPRDAEATRATLPGKIAEVLDLVDTQRVPVVTYSPPEELFTLHLEPGQKRPAPIERRMAVNRYPNRWYLVEFYLKLRETMISKGSVFHKRWRGTCASAIGRFISMNDAISHYVGNLGRKDWELDHAREIPMLSDFRALDAKSTTATVEHLKNDQAALVWVNIIPERFSGAGGGGFPNVKAAHYFKWADKHTPWKWLMYHLNRSPSKQLRAPSVSPSSEEYQIYPDGNRPPPPDGVAQDALLQVESCYFLHLMPLFMETFGADGRRAARLWDENRRNNNLPVVFSWQDQYVWFIWRNGPYGPLELQQTGWWIPRIPQDHPNYAREQKERVEIERRTQLPPYGLAQGKSDLLEKEGLLEAEKRPKAEKKLKAKLRSWSQDEPV